jgi:hypothetical protein
LAITTLAATILDTDKERAPVLNSFTVFAGLSAGTLGAGALVTFAPAPKKPKKRNTSPTPTPVPLQMRLRCARLPESPTPIREHRVFMAEIGGTNAPFCHLLDDLSKSGNKVVRLRASLGWNRKTDRLPVNDRRRGIAGSAIEAPFC